MKKQMGHLLTMAGLLLACAAAGRGAEPTVGRGGALDGVRPRVIVATDIGGTDVDDFQSMVHVLLYSDVLEIEGLISSPFDQGSKESILGEIDAYAKDYPNLRTYSDRYPTPEALRAITKQGGQVIAPYSGLRGTSEGSQWIVQCARRKDPRPLNVLVWGALEDVAQALHDAPDILPKLRVYYIGGPNKKWGPDAYYYVAAHFPKLWMIENNSTYRGYFAGGNQTGEWSDEGFVEAHIAGKGALGALFLQHVNGGLKMGDTPSVNWLLKGMPEEPTWPGWGGRFVRAWDRPYARFDRLTTAADRMEEFGILELVLPVGTEGRKAEGRMMVGNQSLVGYGDGEGHLRFRFCPKSAGVFRYKISSNVAALDGKAGAIRAVPPMPEEALEPSAKYPNWWTDDPSPGMEEGGQEGAKSVSQWREEFLRDFAQRMLRCAGPAGGDAGEKEKARR